MNTSVLTFWMFCMILCVIIGQRKNIGIGSSLLFGFLLGVIGVIIMLCMKPGLPAPPPGMYVTKCKRCAAVQNVPQGQAEFTCWQCKTAQHCVKGIAA